MGIALGIPEPEFFECPAKCGDYLLAADGSYGKIGEYYDDAESGDVAVRLGQCPSCIAYVCIRCQGHVPADPLVARAPVHKCADHEGRTDGDEPDAASLAMMAAIGKKCPACGSFIEKNEGCDWMMCGTKAHGTMQEVVRNGGCGWHDLDNTHRRGRPVTARQIKGHPKCKRPECNRYKTVDGLGPGLPFHVAEGTQGRNNGGDHCCDKCAEDGTHQVFCHAFRWKAT